MRILIPFTLAILAAAISAQEPTPAPPAEAIIKDGKLTDPVWNFTYEARGLERGLATPARGVLFEGRAAGGIQIAVRVMEAPKELEGAKWREMAKASFSKAKRKMQDVVESSEGTPTLTFTESKLDIFTEEHGYAFYPRGYQCFVVHAFVADKTETSGKRISECLNGLKAAKGAGPTMQAFMLSMESGLPIDDPRILIESGRRYSAEGAGRNLTLAMRVLKQARKAIKPDSLPAPVIWQLYETGGHAQLASDPRDLKGAIEWLTLAEQAAGKMPEEQRANAAGLSAYNLACAYSLAGEIEKGYEALYRSLKDKLIVDAGHLTSDTDLNNLKKDTERWDKFWKERVAGR